MDVYLDGERLHGAGTTLSATLDAARAGVGTGRLIVEAYADGATIPDDHLAQPPDTDPYASEIKLISADGARLVQGPLLQASERIGALEGRHAEIASKIQAGEAADALGELGEVIEEWIEAKHVFELSAQLFGPEIGGEPGTIDGAVDRLTGALTEIKRSVEAQDWSGMSDALEFDLDPLTIEWSAILAAAAGRVLPVSEGGAP